MKRNIQVLAVLLVLVTANSCSRQQVEPNTKEEKNMKQKENGFPVQKSEEVWREELTEEEYYVLREQGTEPAGSGDLLNVKERGIYVCAGCGQELFHSDTKFDSGTGWPSFWQPISESVVEERPDPGILGTRTEIICARCGGHLGHVFEDGPEPTGLRYCINSVALQFEMKKGADHEGED